MSNFAVIPPDLSTPFVEVPMSRIQKLFTGGSGVLVVVGGGVLVGRRVIVGGEVKGDGGDSIIYYTCSRFRSEMT